MEAPLDTKNLYNISRAMLPFFIVNPTINLINKTYY